MTDPRPLFSGVDPRLVPTVEVFERPIGERPAHDNLDAIAEWLVGPARGIASGVRALDECWRLLAAGLPLHRVTLHTSTLHPQYLGATFTWFRTTGQAVLTMIAHELADRIRYEDTPVRRVVLGGETLRRRIDVADAVSISRSCTISRRRTPPIIWRCPLPARTSPATTWSPT
jgi:adenylate cyclase